MEVILVEDVSHVGRRGDVVRVANGYGRNYLIPMRLALFASPANLKIVEQQRLSRARKDAKNQEEAGLLARELEGQHAILSRKSGDTGLLFGSVTSRELADVLSEGGIEIDRRKILLDQPIKRIGNYRVEIRPHAEVKAELLVSILMEEEVVVRRLKKQDEESNQIVADLEIQVEQLRVADSETDETETIVSEDA